MTVRTTEATLRDAHQSLLATHMHSEDMAPIARRVALEMLQNKTDSDPPKKHVNIPS